MTEPSKAHAFYAQARNPSQIRRPWLKVAGRNVAYGELADLIDRFGGLLAAHGVGAADRVVIALNDDVDASLGFLSLICHGVTCVQIDAATRDVRAAALIRRARPALVILDAALKQAWPVEAGAYPVIEAPARTTDRSGGLASLLGGRAARGGLEGLLRDSAPVAPPINLDPETLAYILFTSGTTSESKGVCISHRALFAHLKTLSMVYGLNADSQILNTLILSHADGSIQGPVLAFANGACVHRPLTFEIGAIERLLDAVFQLRITHMVAAPTMMSLIVRIASAQADAFQGGDFRLLISCGAQLEPELWTRMQETFGVSIVNVYGLTETVAGGVFAGAARGSGRAGPIGVPVDCELRIVGDNGSDVAGGGTGELLIRGDLLMSGYFDDEPGTAAALRDGWLHTGDIAREDEAGDYWICGRKKSVIIRGSLNIHPEEIVEVLNRHPLVTGAVAFGEADPEWGETVTAVVAATGEVSPDDLYEHCRQHLEARKVPTRIVVTAELPKGRSGKVIIEEARALAANPPQLETPTGGGGIEDQVLASAAQTFGVPVRQLSLASSPKTVVGWDSLAHLNLVFAVEKAFAVRLSPREIMSLDSLGKIADLVRSR